MINHLLSQNDWMQSKLEVHKDKIILIEISGLKTIFRVEGNGQLQLLDKSNEFNCIIKLTINDLMSQLIEKKNGKILIEGDLELANEVSQVLKKIEWDIEEDLAKYIGDIPAIRATNMLKKIRQSSKKNLINLTGALVDYWQEENQILTKKRDVENFNKDTDRLVENTDRLEARLNSLVEKLKL